MNVLFMNFANNLPASMVSDYQTDMLFHGLRSILGKNCQESSRMWWMYSKEKEDRGTQEFNKIWGRGYSIYSLLPEIEKNNYDRVDKVIIPIHHTLTQRPQVIIDQLNWTKNHYPKAKVCVIDGWDRTDIAPVTLQICRDNGYKYFKRECIFTDETVKPISFAFPKEKIPSLDFLKNRDNAIAPLIPVNQSIDPSYMSTYIYDDEESYYKMYQDSFFALTSKKGGWDTLRHYEIMANGAIPIFVDIRECPEHTLWNFPKDLCKRVLRLPGLTLNIKGSGPKRVTYLESCSRIDINSPGDYVAGGPSYLELSAEFTSYFHNNLTTDKLATYVLETMDEDN